MKAIVYHKYGSPDVLQTEDVEKPTPKENRVLVKVHAASINAGDWREMRADPFLIRMGGGLLRPKDPRLGSDVSGRVEGIGENVTRFRRGMRSSDVLMAPLPSMPLPEKCIWCRSRPIGPLKKRRRCL